MPKCNHLNVHRIDIMKNMIKALTILVIITGLSIVSCKKKEDAQPVNNLESFSFIGLTAENSTLTRGGSTKITATATGQNLRFIWSTTIGILSGSGAQIEYYGCCVGTYDVTCTLEDSNNNSQEKKVTIVVE